MSFAFTLSKLAMDIATKLIKAEVHVHNAESVRDEKAIIFVINHFTRLETMLLPYLLYKHTGRLIWSLAAAELFAGRLGSYLRSMGTVSTKDPDRDTTIIRSLLKGEHPWILFPEGAMIKDKKVVDHRGMFEIYSNGTRRPPHRGAAVLALRAEYYRHKLLELRHRQDQIGLDTVLAGFGLESFDEVADTRTIIVPVNITYFPIRAHDNVLKRIAQAMAHDLSPRALDELSVEGTVLAENTRIDVALGDPIDVRAYLRSPRYENVMACRLSDMANLERDPESIFSEAGRELMLRYMRAIYDLTTVNTDHLLALLLRGRLRGRLSTRCCPRRLFLAGRAVQAIENRHVHPGLVTEARRAVCDEPSPPLDEFIDLAIREGVLVPENGGYRKRPFHQAVIEDFHTVREHALTYVIANEVEPLTDVVAAVARVARMSPARVARETRTLLVDEDRRIFEEDYRTYYVEALSKGPDVGRPFLLEPRRLKHWRPRGGIVLIHGYMAAPLEVRALAEHLRDRGFLVYGVRLKGHGTSPEDLAQTHWEEWYESVNRAYAIVKTLTDTVLLGGFSMGAGLALLAAGRKRDHIRGTFAVAAPLHLRNYMVKLVPSLVNVNTFLKKMRLDRTEWEYVENTPENPHINYTRNPLLGIKELGKAMDAMERVLPDITTPTFVLQASEDPLVAPSSAPEIFARIGTSEKQMMLVARKRHGIINGEGAEEVFQSIDLFLDWAQQCGPAGSGPGRSRRTAAKPKVLGVSTR
ncbi:MAG TPA: alpha/beta fold hydrolase [Candidatus Hydrogenedentes bacterium]|nr:alpha/beta fold hydrolase [Candidatus Hydrogenedentota bacterium]HPG67192.1 alpha/beta fold hydrolase [Candidatus Hydrogenedentota bacterium]